jgi:hypothetical protein
MAAWPADPGYLHVHIKLPLSSAVVVREQTEVVVALTQDHVTSDVRRGENRGRMLTHSAVARDLALVGTLKPTDRMFDATVTLPVARTWNLDDVRIVGLLQERSSRRIVGAGVAGVSVGEGRPQ